MSNNHNNENVQRFCASCGVPIDTAHQFCRKCGTQRKVAISKSTKIAEPRKGDQKLFIGIGSGVAIAAVAIIVFFVFPFEPIKPPLNGDETDDIITPAANVTEPELLVNENNQFALDFYSKVANENETNLFFSPWSIMNAFSVAYEGANGMTANEISSVFHLPAKEKLRSSVQAMQKYLNEENSEYEIRNANALWVKNGFGIKDDFVTTARQFYDSKVEEVSFPEDEVTIDSWVENKTNNKIKDLVKGTTNHLTRFVITNAIYFNGTWQNQFNENETQDDDFRVNKNTTITVQMMSIQSAFPYFETTDLQILEMPYSGDRLSMLVFLPRNDELDSLENLLTQENLAHWQKSTVSQQVIVYFPKFKLEKEYDLIETLKQLGIVTAFEDDADFTNISNEPLKIGVVRHKAFVDVNEQGTEAAAATEIEMMVGASPDQPPPSHIPVFRADHPFLFMIQDDETGLVLFVGRIEDPR